jgi:hypothetical protein
MHYGDATLTETFSEEKPEENYEGRIKKEETGNRSGRKDEGGRKNYEVRLGESPHTGVQAVRWRRRKEPQGCKRHRWVKPRGRKERERVSQSVRWRRRRRILKDEVRIRKGNGESD